MTGAPAIEVDGVSLTYPGHPAVTALDDASLTVERGAFVSLVGPSGCGKSTLLGLLAGVLLAGAGSVSVNGSDWARLAGGRRDAARADGVGYIF
ncbi:MAG: ATP-binding cassette domain-containing protein, partial [Dehalococcoidia bacterium]|nr:ATP-binding cassette domain-containing protein [Dehalococcoidia bacterium]